jgi:hypothetical protein
MMDKYSFDDHQNKCRLCFKPFRKRHQNVSIDGLIESKFLAVTRIKLKRSQNYSNQICFACDRQLNEFTNYKSLLVEQQLRLYEIFPEDEKEFESEENRNDNVWDSEDDEKPILAEPEFFNIDVKQEPEDEIVIKKEIVSIEKKVKTRAGRVVKTAQQQTQQQPKVKKPRGRPKSTSTLPKTRKGKKLCFDCGKYYAQKSFLLCSCKDR